MNFVNRFRVGYHQIKTRVTNSVALHQFPRGSATFVVRQPSLTSFLRFHGLVCVVLSIPILCKNKIKLCTIKDSNLRQTHIFFMLY